MKTLISGRWSWATDEYGRERWCFVVRYVHNGKVKQALARSMFSQDINEAINAQE